MASFGFDSSILTAGPKRVWRFHRNRRMDDPYIETLPNGGHRLKVYNYVRHHDGGVTRLDPMLEAVYEDVV